MNKNEGLNILKLIKKELDNPNQFYFNFEISGTTVNATGGSGSGNVTGINSVVSGGSNNIGFQSVINTDSGIKLQQKIDTTKNEQTKLYQETIENLIDLIEKNNLNESNKNNIMEKLKSTWIPSVITSIIGSIAVTLAKIH